jgi:PAS domain S-box-containing protein
MEHSEHPPFDAIFDDSQGADEADTGDMGKQKPDTGEQIEQHKRSELEQRIVERTAELARANMLLQEEIAEHRRTTAALKRSEQRLQHLMSSSPVVIFSCKPSGDYGATFVSDNVQRIFGYTPYEFTSRSDFWASHIHPDDAPRVFANLPQLFETGYHKHEYRFLHADTSYRQVENYLRLLRDDEKNPIEIVGSLHDITERKNLEREVARQERLLNAFFSMAPAGLALLDKALCYLYINESAARMSGPSVEEHLGRPVHEVLPDLAERINPLLEHILTTGEPMLNIEVCGETPSFPGRMRYWQGSYFPIYENQDDPAGIGCIFVEITERKDAEASLQQARDEMERRVRERTQDLARSQEALAMQKDTLARQVEEQTRDLKLANLKLARAARLKDEFLANMSHELRTPLNAILGQSEVLQEEIYGPLTERQQSTVRSIEESGKHLLELINDILDLSKIESGKTMLEMGEVAVETLCHASIRLIRNQAHKKRLRVSESLDTSVTTIIADERRLKQMLVNLLTNAVKFTPEGGRIELDVTGDPEHESVAFTVSDTGIGIAQEDMGRLFKPFVQLDSGLDRKHEGTGLGLSLVARLAEMHGGSVRVESEVGKGSSFTITLPWVQSDTQTAGEHTESTATIPSAIASGLERLQRVLIVEDSASAAEQITRYLRELGIETLLYQPGEDIVQWVLQTRPDLIVLDILLPDVSGWDMLTALKANPQTWTVPVLIISVVDEPDRGLTMGAARYLVKPVSRQQFQAALRSIFPLARFEQPEKPAPSAPAPAPSAGPPVALPTPPATPLILLAEDNEDNISMISEYLFTKGYRVEIARNGKEALDVVQHEPPDLILMDVQMPGMDGLEATRRLRANPEMSTIPIIALTALAMPGDRERCLQAGATEYMSKPVSIKNLTRMIQRLLAGGE